MKFHPTISPQCMPTLKRVFILRSWVNSHKTFSLLTQYIYPYQNSYLSLKLFTRFLHPLKNCLTLVKYLPRPLKVRRRLVLKLSKEASKGLALEAVSWSVESRIAALVPICRVDIKSNSITLCSTVDYLVTGLGHTVYLCSNSPHIRRLFFLIKRN